MTTLEKLGDMNACIIDVRTNAEHHQCALQLPHHHIPLDQLDIVQVTNDLKLKKEQPIFLLCHAGRRAEQAAQKFRNAGYIGAVAIEGGIVACQQKGMVVTNPARLSIERQVRIIAGGMVLLGVVVGVFVFPPFIWVSAAIGAGLLFAGLTDWCGVGILLAKAPWNRS